MRANAILLLLALANSASAVEMKIWPQYYNHPDGRRQLNDDISHWDVPHRALADGGIYDLEDIILDAHIATASVHFSTDESVGGYDIADMDLIGQAEIVELADGYTRLQLLPDASITLFTRDEDGRYHVRWFWNGRFEFGRGAAHLGGGVILENDGRGGNIVAWIPEPSTAVLLNIGLFCFGMPKRQPQNRC